MEIEWKMAVIGDCAMENYWVNGLIENWELLLDDI